MDTTMDLASYEVPAVAVDETRSDLAMAWVIFVVLIVAVAVLGGVALFCIAKGRHLVWFQRGWTHFTIACE